MHKQPEITDATREAFATAFLSLLRKKTIDKITVRELAQAAGYNRTTFYNYFTDVYQLYAYIEDYVFAHIKDRIKDNMRHIDRELQFIRTFTQIYDEWKEPIAVLLAGAGNDRFIGRLKEQLIQYWRVELQFPAGDIRREYALDFYLSAVLSVISRWLKNQQDLAAEDLAKLLRELLTGGVIGRIIAEEADGGI